ncbi:MAG: TM2 domain-containing protein [Bacteroidia bacterium]|nr:TM2 domain-containing protein [Bacteroidia bacterium]
MRYVLLFTAILMLMLTGTRVYAAAAPAAAHPVLTEQTLSVAATPDQQARPRRHHDNDRNWVVALLLCIFLGVFGIHRFYLGYPVWGIIFLLTGGLFGIGYVIDLVRIILHWLKPKRGSYTH